MTASNRAAPIIGTSVIGSGPGARGSADVSGLIPTSAGARRAWPWLPSLLIPGRVFLGPCGELIVARADGGLDFVELGGRPHGGAAADPSNAGKPRRYP